LRQDEVDLVENMANVLKRRQRHARPP
jgi:hypothetical protein